LGSRLDSPFWHVRVRSPADPVAVAVAGPTGIDEQPRVGGVIN